MFVLGLMLYLAVNAVLVSVITSLPTPKSNNTPAVGHLRLFNDPWTSGVNFNGESTSFDIQTGSLEVYRTKGSEEIQNLSLVKTDGNEGFNVGIYNVSHPFELEGRTFPGAGAYIVRMVDLTMSTASCEPFALK
ncbi:MAG: hypothetical protein NXY57DRAFT_518926 [Lentinula lateritia]|nr:MAG: hypothetical protein NXY57DRAFT_518926 [Lentinula lateritia]